jgi:tRNA(Ile)-lysidine synthase
MRADGPVRRDEAAGLFAGLAGLRVGVAVSGGSDSTALLHLLLAWGGAGAIKVLTVDHGLRAGSADEARRVADLSARLGVPARILRWEHDGPPPATNVMDAARRARIRLLAAAARAEGLDAVALAHTLDDVAETLVLRLARGSGLKGLSAMAGEREVAGMRFVRPLLGLPKARLVATLAEAGLPHAEDPSNAAVDRFERARVRALMPVLATLGATADRLAGTALRLARADAAVERMVDDLEAAALVDHGGAVSIDRAALAVAPQEAAFRLLARAALMVRPGPYPPEAAVLEAVAGDLAAGRTGPRRRTAGGVVFDRTPDRLWLYAEAGRRGFPTLVVEAPGTHLWDGRFEIVFDRPPGRAWVIAAARGAMRRDDLPPRVAATLPAAVPLGEEDGPGLSGTAVPRIRPVTQV